MCDVSCRYAARQQWLLHWLSHNHLPVRSAAAQLIALSASSMDAPAAEALLALLLANLPTVSPGSSSSSKLLEEQEGSMLAVGELSAAGEGKGKGGRLGPQEGSMRAVCEVNERGGGGS